MDRIKTYITGMVEGFAVAFNSLDALVATDPDLRGNEIKSVQDSYLIVGGRTHKFALPVLEECVVRTVVYKTSPK